MQAELYTIFTHAKKRKGEKKDNMKKKNPEKRADWT